MTNTLGHALFTPKASVPKRAVVDWLKCVCCASCSRIYIRPYCTLSHCVNMNFVYNIGFGTCFHASTDCARCACESGFFVLLLFRLDYLLMVSLLFFHRSFFRSFLRFVLPLPFFTPGIHTLSIGFNTQTRALTHTHTHRLFRSTVFRHSATLCVNVQHMTEREDNQNGPKIRFKHNEEYFEIFGEVLAIDLLRNYIPLVVVIFSSLHSVGLVCWWMTKWRNFVLGNLNIKMCCLCFCDCVDFMIQC